MRKGLKPKARQGRIGNKGDAGSGGAKVLKKGKVIKLDNSQRKSIRSLKKRAAEHRQKLEDYIANPDKCDHRGFLKNENTSELREKIIRTRVNNLKRQIDTFEKDIDAIKNRLK